MIELVPAGCALFDAEDRYVLWNAMHREAFAGGADLIAEGTSFAEVLRHSAARGHFADAVGRVDAWVAGLLAWPGGNEDRRELRLADGRWLSLARRRLADRTILRVSLDITELKRREEWTGFLFENNPVPMYVFDHETLRFLDVNAAALTQYGYPRERFLAMTAADIRPAEEAERLRAELAKGVPRFGSLGQWLHRRADGSQLRVETYAHDFELGGRRATVVAAVDITKRLAVEEALRESEARLRDSERHLANAQRIAAIGSFERKFPDGEYFWSDELYEIFGVDRQTFTLDRESVLALIHPEERERYIAWRDQTAEQSATLEYRIIRPSGEQRVLYCERETVRAEDGSAIGLVGTVRDVTEAKAAKLREDQLETQLRHSQRMESLGTLAGGIAHDLNNTLVPVVALAKRLAARVSGPGERGQLELIRQAGERARDLVKQILAFSRKDVPVRQPLDLADFIDEALPLIRAGIPARIRIDWSTQRDLPPIVADPGQLHQVLINLVTNAVQAIGNEHGVIELSLAACERPPGLRFSVRDTGCGMDSATLERIFDPFFTTKPVGEGTGLGLSVVHGIIANHGARIAVDSTPGRGTRFDITFPAASQPAETAAV